MYVGIQITYNNYVFVGIKPFPNNFRQTFKVLYYFVLWLRINREIDRMYSCIANFYARTSSSLH